MGAQAGPLNKRVNNFVFARTYFIFVSRLLDRTRDMNTAQKCYCLFRFFGCFTFENNILFCSGSFVCSRGTSFTVLNSIVRLHRILVCCFVVVVHVRLACFSHEDLVSQVGRFGAKLCVF